MGLVLVLLILLGAVITGTAASQSSGSPKADPLGSFQSPGPAAPLNWTGDGQRIQNPSFEAGTLKPWVQSQSNAATGSKVQLNGTGYEGASSVALTAVSGNGTSDSYISLITDLGSQQVGFSGSLRFRAALFVDNLTGNSSSDRIEVSITLTTSPRGLKTIHYFFSSGSLPLNSTSDAYFKITGSKGQWIHIDRNVAADALAGFSADFSSLDSVQDARLAVYSKTTGNDPKIKYFDANGNFAWDIDEPVIYDGNSDRYYEMLNDQIIDGPSPGTALKADNRIKFVDSNGDMVRNANETVVYDSNNNNLYDNLEPLIAGRRPDLGTVLSVDQKLKFDDVNSDNVWNSNESVIYDNNSDGIYEASDPIVDGPVANPVYLSLVLQDDQRIRFVDSDNNGIFDVGEPIIFDANNNGVYDAGESRIGGPAPSIGTRFYQVSAARFDSVELYSATGNFEWIRNNGFETGSLDGWGAYGGGFQATTLRPLSGSYSVDGTVSGRAVDMAQSLDSEPRIEPWSNFKASAYITEIGATSQDFVDVWLGLVDNSSEANPAFIHYLLKTGDGTVPADTPSSIYRRPSGFGTLNRWLNVSSVLQNEISSFSTAIYKPPFHLLVVGIQLSAQGTSRTTASFDDFSYFGPYHPGPHTSGSASSYRYATDGQNSTYVFTAFSIPHGAFFLLAPSGQSVLNITSPEGLGLPLSEYTTSISSGNRRIDVPVSTMFRYAPLGTWRIFTTSSNMITVHTEDPITRALDANFDPGSTAILVSRSRDPFGTPISAAEATLTLWDNTGSTVLTQTGLTSPQGWFNATVTLPSTNGVYKLQATVNSTYVGVRTFKVFIGPQPLTADFTFSPAAPTADTSVIFTAMASFGKAPYTFSWSFGDKTVGTGSSASHAFPLKGSYTVVLTVTDANGANLVVGHTVDVHYELIVTLNISNNQPSAGSQVELTGQVFPLKPGVNVTISYHPAGEPSWTAIGTSSTAENGTYSYSWTPKEGDYEVQASVGDSLTSPARSNKQQILVGPASTPIPWLLAGVGISAAATAAIAFFAWKKRKNSSLSNRTSSPTISKVSRKTRNTSRNFPDPQGLKLTSSQQRNF